MRHSMQVATRCRAPRRAAWLLAVLVALAPATARAQQVAGGDFDICDYCGNVVANTLHLTGRPGHGTDIGEFTLVNAANDAQDVDHDGWTPGVDFNNLYLQLVTDFRDISNPDRVIQAKNLVLQDFLNPLRNGFQNNVGLLVDIPDGTPAGTYRGVLTIADSVLLPGLNPDGETLRSDILYIEITVLPTNGTALVQADTAAPLDSVVIRGRAGQRASTVFRVANTGNIAANDLRISVSDLHSESAVNLVIPAENISFSPPSFASVPLGDTVRVTVTVDIPRGLLSGKYRGTMTVGAADTPGQQIPLIVIVTSTRGILFADNPVRSANGVEHIAFNGDPGTPYHIAIFDMAGLLVWTDNGQVFAGMNGSVGAPGLGADYAVSYAWPLRNGVGEPVASGMYLVVVESIVGGQRQLSQDKLMVIR